MNWVEGAAVMLTEMLPAGDLAAVERALELLRGGGVVAFPTDTVYGVGGLAASEQAVHTLYAVKERSSDKAIPVLIGGSDDLERIAVNVDARAYKLAQLFWPGPLTLVLTKRTDLPSELSPYPTVGVRMPDHPDALTLLRKAGPMAVTSANLSGDDSPSTPAEVYAQLGGRIPLILDGGQTPGGVPSTVVDCTNPELRLLRSGPLSLETLREALKSL